MSALIRRCPSFADDRHPVFLRRAASLWLFVHTQSTPIRSNSCSVVLADDLPTPVSLILYPPKHHVPNDASQKVLSLSSSQSSFALFHDQRPFRGVSNKTENMSDFLSSPLAPTCDKLRESCNNEGEIETHTTTRRGSTPGFSHDTEKFLHLYWVFCNQLCPRNLPNKRAKWLCCVQVTIIRWS